MNCSQEPTDNSPETRTPVSCLRRVSRSSFVLFMVLLVVGGVAMLSVPSRFLNPADGVPPNYRSAVSKLSDYLGSSANPDIVILGSSLILHPSVRCDDRLAGLKDCFDDWYYYERFPEYSRSNYLEHLLGKAGVKASIANLGIASSIMSDHAGVFETIVKAGKHPKMAVCAIAPRDFLDNTMVPETDTPAQFYLREYQNTDGISLPKGTSKDALTTWSESEEHHLKKFIARVRGWSTDLACQISGHPKLPARTRTKLGEPGENKLKDLGVYRRLYNPPNFKLLARQEAQLKKFLACAKENGIAVLLINMPLTKENLSTLDKKAHETYIATIYRAAKESGATLLDIGVTGKYPTNDFEDCCHLNRIGGEKLFAEIVDRIVKDEHLMVALSPDSTRPRPSNSDASLLTKGNRDKLL